MKNSFLIIAAIVSLLHCSNKDNGTLLDDIKRRGVLRVGVSVFIPWVMNDKSGRLVGFEVDVANALAKDLGVRVEFVNTGWTDIIPALKRGEFDMIIGGMTVTSERMEQVDFTDPYNYGGMSIVANRRIAPGYKSLDEFNERKMIIGVRDGSTAVDAAMRGMPFAQLRIYNDEHAAVKELIAGRVHAIVASSPFPEFQARKNREALYLPLSDTFTSEPTGIALRKHEGRMKRYLNEWIKKRWRDGFLTDRKNYWFRSEKWERSVY